MKTLAYSPVLYGKEYLGYAIESVLPYVDKFLILYTARPTYGTGTTLKNPDSKEDIKAIADQFGSKIIWREVPKNINGEGNHRTIAESIAYKTYDIVMAVDSDEVWRPETVEPCIRQAWDGKEKRYMTNHQGWYNFWRSFNEVHRDAFEPVRFVNMKRNKNKQGRVTDNVIYHFGYANRVELQRYKMSVHGHSAEFAKEWFDEKWLNYKKGETTNMHPASPDVWKETQDFDKTTLPDLLKKHPYYNLDRIE